MKLRICIVAACTLAGALWILLSGPMLVVRGMTPSLDQVPFWYQISAFPVLGLVLADLAAILQFRGLTFPALNLALQVSIVCLLSGLRLDVRVPLSGHALLAGYFLAHRALSPHFPGPLSRYEVLFVTMVLLMVAYVKLFRWTDPLTLVVGFFAGVVIATAGRWLETRSSPRKESA